MLATRMRSIQPAVEMGPPISLPAFSSSNTSGVYTVSANSVLGLHEAYFAFNRTNASDGDCWSALNATMGTAYLLLDCGSAKSINRYKVQGYYNGTIYPTAWTLYGSDNNSDWTIIESKTGQDTSSLQTYSISTVSYRYYKFLETACAGGFTRAIIGRLDYEYV